MKTGTALGEGRAGPVALPLARAPRRRPRSSSASAAGSVPAARPVPLEIREVDDEAALDEVLAAKRAILYKHSTRCVVSAVVIEDVKPVR